MPAIVSMKSIGNSAADTVNIGFSFNFYGTDYTSVGVAANGGLLLPDLAETGQRCHVYGQ